MLICLMIFVAFQDIYRIDRLESEAVMTKQIQVGTVPVGGGAPGRHTVYVQHQDGRCGGDGSADSALGGRRM